MKVLILFLCYNRIIIANLCLIIWSYKLHMIKFQALFLCLLFPLVFNFRLQAKPIFKALPEKIFAGELHYSRIPVQYWEHRIQMVRALGLNALSVPVFWNFHEIAPGEFDYESQNKNLSGFLDLALKYDMKVLFRPGPYNTAQWDLGGLPARLLGIQDLYIRENNKKFLEQVKTYFESLVPIIIKYTQTESNPKGNIILLQIQSQYGLFGKDKAYTEAIRKLWIDFKVNCPFYYVDSIQNIEKFHWNGANIGIKNAMSNTQFSYVKLFETEGYIFAGENYAGKATCWGRPWSLKQLDNTLNEFTFLLSNNHSFAMYMAHGGTNFGLTAGALGVIGQQYDYMPYVTSYDYDAPINQQGSSTLKYQNLKNLIKKYVSWNIPQEPLPIKMIEIPRTKLSPLGSLLQNLGAPVITDTQNYYEFQSEKLKMFNQGITVYETTLIKRTYQFQGYIHDYAQVYLDGLLLHTLDRSTRYLSTFIVNCQKDECILKIVVEAMGHFNEYDKKGIIDFTDDIGTLFKWNYYTVQIEDIIRWKSLNYNFTGQTAVLLRAVFNITEAGDVYFDLKQLNKGYIWVNGRNLGRYWKKGPQNRLFCPGVWLKKGENIVHVFEQHYDGKQKGFTGLKTLHLIEEKVKIDATE